MGLVESRLQEIHDSGGEVFGISVDSPYSQAKWAELEGFPNVPMLSDLGGATARAYGAIYEDLGGMKGVAMRSAFLIDPAGKIVHLEVMENAKEIPDIAGAIEKLKALA